jgi:soluble lytic murein transglycosylase-like protein
MTGTTAGWLRIPAATQAKYQEEIKEIADRHGLSPSLVESVIRVESAFNASAVSRKGAQGLMQLMPQTATSLGVRNAFDPRQNIEGGVRHLRYLIDRYPGNLPLALAAYNAGAGAVDTYRGIPPYPETQDYVRKILQFHGGRVGVSKPIYRYENSRGSVTYTNVPPAARIRLR